MPLLADFTSDLDGDRILVPHEVAEHFRASGGLRLRVRLEPASDDPRLLSERGIDQPTIELVADIQKIGLDIASFVLAGEGIAEATPLGLRLNALVSNRPGVPAAAGTSNE